MVFVAFDAICKQNQGHGVADARIRCLRSPHRKHETDKTPHTDFLPNVGAFNESQPPVLESSSIRSLSPSEQYLPEVILKLNLATSGWLLCCSRRRTLQRSQSN